MTSAKSSIFKRISVLFVVFLSFAVYGNLSSLYAATSMSLSPASGTYTKDSTIKVSVYANTGGDFVNAVQANFSYPTDKLQFLSVNTSGSALTIFAEKTAAGGVVRIAGGTPSPGFSGNKFIASVSFRVLQDTGAVALAFTGETAAYRDSDNANVIGAKGGATYTLGQGTAPTKAPGTTSLGSVNTLSVTQVAVQNVGRTNAVISWKTSIAATSSVEYGPNTEYGFSESSDKKTLEHSITLDQFLAPGTTYHFRVKSESGSDQGQSDDYTFKTKGYDFTVRATDGGGKALMGARIMVYPEVTEQITNENGEATFSDMSLGTHGVIIKNNNKTSIHEINLLETDEPQLFTLAFASASSSSPQFDKTILYGFLAFTGVLILSIVGIYIYKQRKRSF
jgi:hypothetical protein